MAMTYEITGIPWLAVRVGRALERWGARSARPLDTEQFHARVARQRAVDDALESRRTSLVGMFPYLR